MNLYEFEGKRLLSKYGIKTPSSSLFPDSKIDFDGPYVVKAQILQSDRLKKGAIKKASSKDEAESIARDMLTKEYSGESPAKVLVEKDISGGEEHYLALSFSTVTRSPILMYSKEGGSGIEKRPPKIYEIEEGGGNLPKIDVDEKTVQNLWDLFKSEDATLVEINPIIKKDGEWIALDAKVNLDDAADYRREEKYEPRDPSGRKPRSSEVKAREVSQSDHRGAAGESYIELEGDIGVIASGGGASVVVMDTLLSYGLSPANYTEYSGNPPREKVKALADIVLDQDLKGLLVVGGNANFTDIYETLMGIMDSVLGQSPILKFPVVIRRGGPRWQEAQKEIEKIAQEKSLNVHFFGPDYPMTYAVKKMVDLLGVK